MDIDMKLLEKAKDHCNNFIAFENLKRKSKTYDSTVTLMVNYFGFKYMLENIPVEVIIFELVDNDEETWCTIDPRVMVTEDVPHWFPTSEEPKQPVLGDIKKTHLAFRKNQVIRIPEGEVIKLEDEYTQKLVEGKL